MPSLHPLSGVIDRMHVFGRTKNDPQKYFYRKRSQLRDGKALVPAGGAFVQVSPESSLEPATDVNLVLQYRECQVQLPLATDPAWLSQLLRSL